MQTKRAFISYRQADSKELSGHLFDAMCDRWTKQQVFVYKDTAKNDYGKNFTREALAEAARTDALLAVIGPDWPGGTEFGARRIDQSKDLVRREILKAQESGARVIPVLVNGAEWDALELPNELEWLRYQRHKKISDRTRDKDIADLLDSIADNLAVPDVDGVDPVRRRVSRLAMIGGVGLFVAAACLVWLLGMSSSQQDLLVQVFDSNNDPIATATTTLSEGGNSTQRATSARGEVSLSMPTGSAVLRVNHPRFIPVELQLDDVQGPLKITLVKRAQQVQVQVVDAANNGVGAATVILDLGGTSTTDVTDDAGRTQFILNFDQDPLDVSVTVKSAGADDYRVATMVWSQDPVIRVGLP